MDIILLNIGLIVCNCINCFYAVMPVGETYCGLRNIIAWRSQDNSLKRNDHSPGTPLEIVPGSFESR